MEKLCEFCTTSRPVVYCKADAAHLCLSCDAKVHSANALSNQHLRTLLCDSCRCHPSYVRCLDHQMFMCCDCDLNLHDISSQHQRHGASSYLGCPPAKDFAALWGFELGYDAPSSQKPKAFIFQQILDLKRLQLNEGDSCRPSIHEQKQSNKCTSMHNSLKNFDGNVGQDSETCHDIGTDLRQSCNQLQELGVDSFPLAFNHLEHLSSSSTVGMALQGESFWQSKSPIQSNQFWSQTMQDLGVCEDNSCPDDFNIPDVDLTFCNFEELFGGQQGPIRVLLDDKDVSYSSVEKDVSLGKSDYGNARSMKDASAASIYGAQSAQTQRDGKPSIQVHNYQQKFDCSHPIQPSYSTMSFPLSRFSNESSSTDCLDSELSPITGGDPSCNAHDLDGVHTEARENAMMRYKEKKKARLHERKIRYESQKAKADVRKRIKSGCAKTEGYDSDTANVARGY
ncbi:hypothetical protein SLA2020_095530 [Shorea laevis]